MLARLVRKSLLHSPGILAWTLVSLSMCALLVTLFVTLDLEIEAKLSHTIRESGANAIARPVADSARGSGGESGDPWDALLRAAGESGAASARIRLQVGSVGGSPVAVAASEPGALARLTPYWRIEGRRPAAVDECLAGRTAAEALHLSVESEARIRWAHGAGKTVYRIVGIFESGDEDERRLFVAGESGTGPAPTGDPLEYALLSVPGGQEGIDALAGALRPSGIELAPLRQFVHGERTVLDKIGLLLALTLVAVLALATVGVSAAVLARVVERRVELGLLQALGAHRRSVAGLLVAESAAQGFAAGLIGFALGTWVAHRASLHLFGLGVGPHAWALVAAMATTTAVAVLAGGISSWRGLRIQPARVLGGEG